MKVRIAFTVNVDEEFRRALAHRYGRTDLATREEVSQWYENNATSVDDDLMAEYRASMMRRKVDS